MAWFKVDFIDGKDARVEADAYPEQRDNEWLFMRDNKIVAQYQSREVRGIQELPCVVKTRGGMRP